ncbi:MAG: nucleotide-binding protein [Nitrospirota bacterium]
MKPRVFVGSSTEALEVAHAIQENLEHDALCKVWTQGIFDLSGSALDNLLNASLNFDFAVFVFQPDDITKIRASTAKTVRDNVVFELGLFIGKLGKEKVYFLVPAKSEGMHLPTDLLGIIPGSYDPPETNGDLLAALGPFCNKIRRQIKAFNIPMGNDVSASSIATSKGGKNSDEKSKQVKEKESVATLVEPLQEVEDGIEMDEFGNFIISREATVFFENRLCKAFPGVRGLQSITDSKEALDRVQHLLQEPLSFERANGHGTVSDPIWWWRGFQCNALTRFLRLSQTRCLLDNLELEIEKVVVWRSQSYHHHFVYVEVRPDQPIGLYRKTEDELRDMVTSMGYAKEEYGLYQNTPITRACYDDGTAFIDGEIVDVSGASLRIHYLTRYNFLIASKFSPINSSEFDEISQGILNNILEGRKHIDELCGIIERLPRFRAR